MLILEDWTLHSDDLLYCTWPAPPDKAQDLSRCRLIDEAPVSEIMDPWCTLHTLMHTRQTYLLFAHLALSFARYRVQVHRVSEVLAVPLRSEFYVYFNVP